MPRLTTQALALAEAYRSSGAPRTRKYGRRAYSVRTEKRYFTHQGVRGYEYGDAYLHADVDSHAQAIKVAEHIAACGYTAVVFPTGDDHGRILATTDYSRAGQVTIYGETYAIADSKCYRVELDEAKRAIVREHVAKVTGY